MNTQISRRGFLCAAGIASASAALTACGCQQLRFLRGRLCRRLFGGCFGRSPSS